MKTISIVLGGLGFIGHHLSNRLLERGDYVIIVDKKSFYPLDDYLDSLLNKADDYLVSSSGDLRHSTTWDNLTTCVGNATQAFKKIKVPYKVHVYQLAADMGGAEYIFSGKNDHAVMSESCQINLNCLDWSMRNSKLNPVVFYSSSACMYPEYNQLDPGNPICSEDSAYPAAPDSEYGWEKLFSERLYLAFHRNTKLDIRIARFHNIYGPECAYEGGREKAPAAICRKVIRSTGEIEIFGDGEQTRSFLYIDDCLDAIELLMSSSYTSPINIGSEEKVTINQLVEIARNISQKEISVNHIDGPLGVRGRTSDNTLIRNTLNWEPKFTLEDGLKITYNWIANQLERTTN